MIAFPSQLVQINHCWLILELRFVSAKQEVQACGAFDA
tara:strand:- start:23 stop:136 length:114 start_codon:yes stop_codon:yes gene_type:complete